jgi:hypothetical protein
MQLYPRLDLHCQLVDPLCQLLLDKPDLALKPRTPKEWAQLLRDFLGDNWDANSKLDAWAVRDCFRHHRNLLEERLDVIKTRSTANPGSIYQLSIRSGDCAADGEFQGIQAGLPSITGGGEATYGAV